MLPFVHRMKTFAAPPCSVILGPGFCPHPRCQKLVTLPCKIFLDICTLDDLVMPVERVKDTPETLDIFADEDHVHLTPKGQAIVPLVTITEGIDASNPKRHKTIHPIHVAAFGMTPDAFRENVLAVLTERYDLDKVKQINIHADCGQWIRGLHQLIPHSRLVLDGYHLEKELRSFLRLEGAGCYAGAIHDSMRKKDGYEAFERYCEAVFSKQTTEKEQKKVRDFVEYCANHWSAIVVRMRKETCGSCTEPQVSHILSERLSRNPIAWSKEGLNRMTMLVVYAKNGGKVCAQDVRIRVMPGTVTMRKNSQTRCLTSNTIGVFSNTNVMHSERLTAFTCSVSPSAR